MTLERGPTGCPSVHEMTPEPSTVRSVDPVARNWILGLLCIAGVLSCWASAGTGFVVGGVIFIGVGAFALLGRSGSWATGRTFQALANASLILVGCVTVLYGVI
jgi:hypothetical protein